MPAGVYQRWARRGNTQTMRSSEGATATAPIELGAWSSKMGVKVVPRGAGTSLSGGALPLADGVLLGLAKLNRILDVDYDKNNFVYDMNQRGPILGLGFRF